MGGPGVAVFLNPSKDTTPLARNAASPVEHFGLPSERTVTVASHVAL
jgi:hypothetical protein